jgi:hypothetical protein
MRIQQSAGAVRSDFSVNALLKTADTFIARFSATKSADPLAASY